MAACLGRVVPSEACANAVLCLLTGLCLVMGVSLLSWGGTNDEVKVTGMIVATLPAAAALLLALTMSVALAVSLCGCTSLQTTTTHDSDVPNTP